MRRRDRGWPRGGLMRGASIAIDAAVAVLACPQAVHYSIAFDGCAREPWSVELRCGEPAFTEWRLGFVWIR